MWSLWPHLPSSFPRVLVAPSLFPSFFPSFLPPLQRDLDSATLQRPPEHCPSILQSVRIATPHLPVPTKYVFLRAPTFTSYPTLICDRHAVVSVPASALFPFFHSTPLILPQSSSPPSRRGCEPSSRNTLPTMAINTWSAGNGYQTVHEHAPRLSPPLPPPPPANAILMSGSPAAPPVACVALPRHYPQQQQQVYPYVRNPPPSMWSPPPHSMATTPTPPPPSPPFAGVTSAGEPFTVYHVCRICHRPRSQRYHREQSVYPDGSALALDICHRCRDVVEVDEVGEERTAMRKKSEARISIHTKPRSDNEGRGQSRASNSRCGRLRCGLT